VFSAALLADLVLFLASERLPVPCNRLVCRRSLEISASQGDPVKDIIEPAVDGTLSLLGSVVKSKDTIERVVLTSSIVGGLTLRVHGKHLIACL